MIRVQPLSHAGVVLRLWCSLWLLGLPAGTAAAQTPASGDQETAPGPESSPDPAPADSTSPASPRRSSCFPGVPGPDCDWFLLSEITTGKRLHQARGLEDDYLTLELGYMESVGPRAAIGVSGSLTWSEDQRYGIHGHYRRWLGRHVSLDLSPGVYASGRSMFDNRLNRWGVSARAGLMFEETFGIGVEMDSGDRFEQKSGTEWKTALRAGGYASFVAVGGLALLGLIYAIAVHDPNY